MATVLLGRTINGESHGILLQRLSDNLKKNQPRFTKKKMFIQEYNTRIDESLEAMTNLNDLDYKFLRHSPYYPDFVIRHIILIWSPVNISYTTIFEIRKTTHCYI